MTQTKRQKLSLAVPDPEIDLWLSMLGDTRRRTWESLKDLPEDSIDTLPSEKASSIGALVYHVAIVEADWLFDEILGTIDTPTGRVICSPPRCAKTERRCRSIPASPSWTTSIGSRRCARC